MSKGMVIGIAVFLGVFGGFNYLLNRPFDAKAGSLHSVLPTPEKSKQSDSRQEVILAMAQFVEKNPDKIKLKQDQSRVEPIAAQDLSQDARAPVVLGIPLDERSIADLSSPMGKARFKSTIESNPNPAIQDVHQAWVTIEERDFTSREALLEMTDGLAQVSSDPSIKGMFLSEVDKYFVSASHENINVEYAGKALQHYLNNESDPKRMFENLDKMGIQHVEIPSLDSASRAPASINSPPSP